MYSTVAHQGAEALKQLPVTQGTGQILRLCPVYNIILMGGYYFRPLLGFVPYSSLLFDSSECYYFHEFMT